MKNKYFSLVITFSIFALCHVNAAEIEKKKVAILDFKTPATTVQEGPLLTEKLISALSENPAFIILKSKTEGADYVAGGYSQLIENQKLIISLHILDGKTNDLIYAKKLTFTAPQKAEKHTNLDYLNDQAICHIKTIISETIDPIKIDSIQGAYAFLSHGASTELHPGMKLQVLIPSKSSVDSNTGEVSRDSEYTIAELKITEILPKLAKAQILHYSTPIEPGTLCRTIPECKIDK